MTIQIFECIVFLNRIIKMTLMPSTFDIFKVGIGPSSSHTMGPMKAALKFVDELKSNKLFNQVDSVEVELHGSLSLTGKGHMTDRAVLLGLSGAEPETVNLDQIPKMIETIEQTSQLKLGGTHPVHISPKDDIHFIDQRLKMHENGLKFHAYQKNRQEIYSNTFYSVGGGFIKDEAHFNESIGMTSGDAPYPFTTAKELIKHCTENNLSISTVVLKNECSIHKKKKEEIIKLLDTKIWSTMKECMNRGFRIKGELPGKLHLRRRCPDLYKMMKMSKSLRSDPLNFVDWMSLYAQAVSEENAAGGRMVTAPTSGSCGVVPAVLEYFNNFVCQTSPEERARFLLTCGAIGLLYKMNASISGAEVGCQGEIGVAASMAAGGLTELQCTNPERVLSAAEIAMEHAVGMTCDPIYGLVQVPCIERNSVGALKAVTASRMALMALVQPRVSLDEIIKEMYVTGKDLQTKYRETAQGGLAIYAFSNRC